MNRAFVLLGFFVVASASARTARVMGHTRSRADWREVGPAEGHKMHDVVFAIKQRNMDELEKIFYAVSDPRNPKYGKHLTYDQVTNLTSNMEATVQVQQWLEHNGATIVHTTKRGDYIKARASINTWEHLLSTTFFQFSHKTQGRILRAKVYSLPINVATLVSGAHYTVQLPPRFAARLMRAKVGTASSEMTPLLLNSYYNIYTNDGQGLGSQSLLEGLDQYYSPDDLSQFQELYDIPEDEVDEVIDGHESDRKCNINANNCAEANLDVQYIMAVAQSVPTTYWYDDASDFFYDWILQVADDTDPPLVHSISYGSIEEELYDTFTDGFNQEAMKLGVKGVTILVSSGDDGVANFQARDDDSYCGYHPSFPATSQYVTAVGATQGPESGTTEIACQSTEGGLITTGGGFSTAFAAPSWQTDAISTYFDSLSIKQKPASGYASSGRGYPDFSMAGSNYVVVIGGDEYLLSGTSASAPVAAGLVSLVNSQRLAAGKSSLGFLNQAIYQNGDIFNDITSGENNCCAGDSDQVCCDEGFYATTSWDPLTGFGSIDFQKFSDVFSNFA